MSNKHPYRRGSNQHRKVPKPFTPGLPEPDAQLVVPAFALTEPSLVASRSVLCEVLDALSEHQDALTVIGAHAVHERTSELPFASTVTKDSDIGVAPELVGDAPLLGELMERAGFSPLSRLAAALPDNHPGRRWLGRPGLWGTRIDENGDPVDEVDLMVPESIAGSGRRSVGSMSGHGKATTGRVLGIELCVLERDLLSIEDFQTGVKRYAYVARHSGLICAKAHKIADRLRDAEGGRDRRGLVIPKDIMDLWRCMVTSEPQSVRAQFDRHSSDPIVGAAVTAGAERFGALIRDARVPTLVAPLLSVHGIDRRDGLAGTFEEWRVYF